jgi:probable phosphoglycerate mutase
MKMPTRNTTFIVIRHGETEWNKNNIVQGQLNSDLTKNGIDQAEAIANEMLERSIDRIVSSDLGRAIQTATIIADVIKNHWQ